MGAGRRTVGLKTIATLLKKISLLFDRDRFRKGLDEDMDFDRAEAEKDLVAQRTIPEEARFVAIHRLGKLTRVREQSHKTVGFTFEANMDSTIETLH
jgi:hypothetical protein